MLFSGIVPDTTLPAPIMQLSPIIVPGRINDLAPIKQSLPICISFKNWVSYLGFVSCNDCDVKLQKGETIDYKWLNKDELIKLYQTDNIPPKQKIRINKLMNKI